MDANSSWAPGQPAGAFTATGRGPRLFSGGGGTQAKVVSTVSTIVVLAALAAVFLLAPGARAVEHEFFSPPHLWHSFIGNPLKGYYSVGAAIWLNIRMFLVAEVLILALALVVALIRQSTGPVLFPIRILATIYVDFFRGVPLLLVIFVLGFGLPALQLPFVSSQPRHRRRHRAVLFGVCFRGLPGGIELGALQPGVSCPFAGPVAGHVAAVRGASAGGAEHHPAAAQRLHQPAKGHRTGRHARGDRGEQGGGHLQRDCV